MKKINIIILCIILILGSFALTGCSGINDEKEKQLKDDTFRFYEEIKEECEKANSNESFFKYIQTWASKENLTVEKINNKNIMVTKEASPGYKNAESTLLQSSFRLGEKKEFSLNNAISLSVLKNIENHGKTSVILTANDDYTYAGTMSLPEKYLNFDTIINLDSWSKTEIIIGSAATSSYQLASSITTTPTKGEKAYKIEISGCSEVSSANIDKHYPNPVANLGKFLSSCNSGEVLIELNSFQGGNKVNTYPTSATAIVVVSASEENKFLSKIEASKQSFMDKYGDTESELSYTIEETPLPKTVISSTCTDDFLSLMYTLEDGVYAIDDHDKPTALSTIAAATLTESQSTFSIMARSSSTETLQEMNTSFEELATLSGYSFQTTSSTVLWQIKENSPLISNITAAAKEVGLKLTSEFIFETTEGAILQSKNPNANIVSLGTSINNASEISQSLYLYLKYEK